MRKARLITSRRSVLVGVAATALLGATPAATGAASPKRIVTLTPFTSSITYRVGMKPVAIGRTLGGSDPAIAQLKGVPVLKLSHPNGPNMEELATYNPDLVLSTKTWHRGVPAMKALGIKVSEIDPESVAAVATKTRQIGKLLGRTTAADKVADAINAGIAVAKQNIRRHPSVLVILGVGRTSYAMLANSWGGDVVRQAGGRLLTAGLKSSSGTAKISDELIVKRNPDVIIAVPHGNPSDIGKLAAYMRDNPSWRSTKAARNKRIYVSTGNSLLQAYPDVAQTIRNVRTKFLHN